MEPVDPRIDPALVPEGSKPSLIAKDQPEYRTLPSVRTPWGQVITRWTLTADERRLVMEGEDIFLAILSPGAMQPVRLTVGVESWTGCPFCGNERGTPHASNCPWNP